MENACQNPSPRMIGARWAGWLLQAAACFGVALLPGIASASTGSGIESVLCLVLDNITSGPGYAVAVAIIIGIGVAALHGKVSWMLVFFAATGIALLFGAGSVVTALGGNGTACTDLTITLSPGTYTGADALSYCNTHIEADGTNGGFYPNPYTDANGNPQMGTPNNEIIRPLIECFTDTTNGIIPTATEAFLSSTQTFFVPLTGMLATLTVSFFGLKLLAGDLQEVKKESFILLFKFAGVFYFLTAAPDIYTQLLTILTGLDDIISNASASLDINGFCNITTGADGLIVANDLWARWDCILKNIFNFSAVTMTGGLLVFLTQLAVQGSIGFGIFGLGIYLLLMLILALVRFLYIYIMAVLSLSFVFVFGYLFVPMILFKNTHQYFQKWLNTIMGFLLMPIVLLGYMGMMLVLFDTLFYSGPNSVWNLADPVDAGANAAPTTANATYACPGTATPAPAPTPANPACPNQATPPATPAPAPAANQTINANAPNNVFLNAALCQRQDQMYGLLYPDYGNIGVSQQDQVQNVNGGIASDNIRYLSGVSASCFQQSPAATTPAAGIDTNTINVAALGGNSYLTNLLTAFAATALLIYITASLVSYIPMMAAGMVSQGSLAMSQMMEKIQMPGQDMLTGMAKKMMTGGAAGGAGGAGGAISGAAGNAGKMVTSVGGR